ncbi:hypothetical protein KSC_030130 [Ktedonobacter sp. SOSP1-52]|uniref:hypothetical protein n=1 Tax=Ktedonobacter sp. SOSP1-52 TaxID=2778366 RepID=UPI001A29A044|nr:hypothetical protein [Ktedonobacter sp. SOSP1-52]GHO64121.1 hypothetical protein KSC_030130 [Ktedonobacter sp. SOSP1-52]
MSLWLWATPLPQPFGVINVDKNAAYPKAIAELKAIGALSASVELRQVNYLVVLQKN